MVSGKKSSVLAAIERRLAFLTTRQTFQTPRAECALQLCHESERVRSQNFGEGGSDFATHLDTVETRDGITVRHRQPN